MNTYYVQSKDCRLAGPESLAFFTARILDKDGNDVTGGVPAEGDKITVLGLKDYQRSIHAQWVEMVSGGFVIHPMGQYWLE